MTTTRRAVAVCPNSTFLRALPRSVACQALRCLPAQSRVPAGDSSRCARTGTAVRRRQAEHAPPPVIRAAPTAGRLLLVIRLGRRGTRVEIIRVGVS